VSIKKGATLSRLAGKVKGNYFFNCVLIVVAVASRNARQVRIGGNWPA
jgi:hypothetical protein